MPAPVTETAKPHRRPARFFILNALLGTLLVVLLAGLFLLLKPLGVAASAATETSVWIQDSDWMEGPDSKSITFRASPEALHCPSGQNLEFPNLMHARHDVFVDNKLVATNGYKDQIRSIYGALIISCDVLRGREITWRVEAHVKSFAKVRSWPKLSSADSINRIEALHLATFGSTFLISIFLLVSCWKTPFFPQAVRIAVFSMSIGLFLALSVLGLFGIRLSVLTVDKIAGLALGVAIFGAVSFLFYRKYIPKWLALGSEILCVLSLAPILFLTNGDQIQKVLDVMLLPVVICPWVGLISLARTRFRGGQNQGVLAFFALGSFAAATSLDVAYTFGLHDWGMSLAYGITGVVLFFGLVIQTEIQAMNTEREHLRSNLAQEITLKTASLERALSDLKSTQAELIQSAKLASLGTLSAGIAHEINNSLNYVNGGMQPLERLITTSCRNEDRPKIDKLLGVMREGLSLTLEIIRSLRNYTGLNQAKFNELDLCTVVKSSAAILRNKLRNEIDLEVGMPETLKIFGSVVGINQVFMNLMSNAIDAMKPGGKLKIFGVETADHWIEVKISDTGCGMSQETLSRIFEPFFTTKEVGSGTGLGLHIVKSEIDRHKAQINVQSETGKGTTFILRFPPIDYLGKDLVDLPITRSAS
jgi:signal transduction histidine kinase